MERDVAMAEIRRLMQQHGIRAAELRDPGSDSGSDSDPGALSRGVAGQVPAEQRSPILARVFAYLGGVFLCSGVVAFVTLNWDLFPPAGRVLMTLGLGLALFVAAFALQRSERFAEGPTPLYLLAALLQPTGMLVAFEEYGGGGDERVAFLLTACTFGLQAVTVHRVQRHAVLVFFALLHFAWALSTGADLLDLDADIAWLGIGAGLLLIAQGLDAARYPNSVRIWTLIGSAAFYAALFSLVEGGWGESLFVLAAAAGVYASVALRSQPLLMTAIGALLGYISYFTAEYFSDALGWPLVLIIIGMAFLGLGRLALWLRSRYLSPRSPIDRGRAVG